MHRTTEDWKIICQEVGAWWQHGGNPKRPHAQLTPELHAGYFFDGQRVTDNPQLVLEAADDLVVQLQLLGLKVSEVGRVIGPVTKLTQALHLAINRAGGRCRWSPLERLQDGGMVFSEPAVLSRIGGELVLFCDDIFSNVSTVMEAGRTVSMAKATLLPLFAVIANCSIWQPAGRNRIGALINQPSEVWEVARCPLCQAGSEAILPRNPGGNWERLAGNLAPA